MLLRYLNGELDDAQAKPPLPGRPLWRRVTNQEGLR
jgi:hypothetical protein